MLLLATCEEFVGDALGSRGGAAAMKFLKSKIWRIRIEDLPLGSACAHTHAHAEVLKMKGKLRSKD